MDSVLGKLDFIDHHMEHELMTLEDQVANLKAQLDSLGPSDSAVADMVRKVPTLLLLLLLLPVHSFSCKFCFFFLRNHEHSSPMRLWCSPVINVLNE